MSLKTKLYKQCNGCKKDDLQNEIEISHSVSIKGIFDGEPPMVLDLCDDCLEEGRYVCTLCRKVHRDESECEFAKRGRL